MLTIADSKLNLSKIQEAVLKVSSVDKEKHLKQYINTVIEIDNIAKDVIDTYSWSRDFSNLSMDTICDENILNCTDGSGKNRWGGNITVSVPEGNANIFTITYTNVPKIPCEQLLSASDENEFHYVSVQSVDCSDNSTMNFFLK